MRAGPDVLTSCGDADAQLRLNEQYVVGVGGACSVISEWSSLDSYSSSELQQLRDYAESFEASTLACGSLDLPSLTSIPVSLGSRLLPSLFLLLMAVAMSVTVVNTLTKNLI